MAGLYDLRDALTAIGSELKAIGEEAEKTTAKAREAAAASAGMTNGSGGGAMGASSSSSSPGGGNGKDKGISAPALAAAMQSLTRRTK